MRTIDVSGGLICTWELEDGVLVDPGPASTVDALLAELDRPPRALLLTHVHLDHAGATGDLVARWPELPVYVHEVGAPHLASPERLLASVARLLGGEEALRAQWGQTRPVPERNLRPLRGAGETVLDSFTCAYTPGHATHHVSYLHGPSTTAFVGDTAGMRIDGSDAVIAPTPPPDIDLPAWERSLDLIADWRPAALAITHFGRVEAVAEHMDAMRADLRETIERVRVLDEQSFVAQCGRGPRIDEICPPYQIYRGARRYIDRVESVSRRSG